MATFAPTDSESYSALSSELVRTQPFSSVLSVKLEGCVRNAALAAFEIATLKLKPRLAPGYAIEHRTGFSGMEVERLLEKRGTRLVDESGDAVPVTGCYPDGGVFILTGPSGIEIPFFAVEAKYQKTGGNAIERWFKNWTALQSLHSNIMLATFASGDGAHLDEVIPRTLNWALVSWCAMRNKAAIRKWNRLYLTGPSMFSAAWGFSEHALVDILEEGIVNGALQAAQV